MGERFPTWDPSARAVMFGLSLHHHRGHIFRAFLEGVTKSEVWRRIFTDVFGVTTALLEGRTGALLGDAILAGVGVGVFKDFAVAKEWSRYGEHLEPDTQNHELYMEYFQLYKCVYSNLKGNFKDLQAIARRNNT